jgi:hypothetical protein
VLGEEDEELVVVSVTLLEGEIDDEEVSEHDPETEREIRAVALTVRVRTAVINDDALANVVSVITADDEEVFVPDIDPVVVTYDEGDKMGASLTIEDGVENRVTARLGVIERVEE